VNKQFDIFISFKATEDCSVTADVAVATELYEMLTACGYRVFFSSKTVFKGGSSDFSREIDNALDSAKLLIVVASKLSYINSRWVEYEWKTFHSDILSNVKTDAQIITYTEGVDTMHMPRILRYVQNFGYGQRDGMLEFIHAFFGDAEMPARPAASGPDPLTNDHTFYNSAGNGEFELLRIRARRSYAMDIQAIAYAKSKLARKKYNVLVLGCAYGFVAETRFGLDDDIEHVICVDKNPQVIEKARELYSKYPHMQFFAMDVQADSYVPQMRKVMEQLGIEGIDLVFTSDIFSYLNNPRTTIRSTRKLLRSDGMLIIRGCDDSNKLAYPDPGNYLRAIVENARKAPGMPNYLIGRELPMLIRNSGFALCDIRMDIHTTIHMTYEEKEEFFLSTFGSRKNIALQILGSQVTRKTELQELIQAIDDLEDCFYDGDFWYSESNLAFIAQKN